MACFNILLTCLAVTAVLVSSKDTEDKTLSPFFWIPHPTTGQAEALPLNATWVTVDIDGIIANVKVTQLYQNRGPTAIDAMYVFPASIRASIRGMQMLVNSRLIVGELHTKSEARKLYEEAKSEGKTASLMEMERPNVLSMNVANILPNDVIRVEIFYTELLQVEHGVYSFMVPATVGLRYGAAKMTPSVSTGISPMFTYGFESAIHAGMPIQFIRSPTHAPLILGGGEDCLNKGVCTLTFPEETPDMGTKDLVIEYSLAGKALAVGSLFYDASKDTGVGGPFRMDKDTAITLTLDIPRDREENFFLVTVQPPTPQFVGEPTRREFLFILDVSGSMSGFPHATSVALLTRIIASLKPTTDYFNILAFAGGNRVFKERSVLADPDIIQEAINIVDRGWDVSGGTELLPALQRAMALPRAFHNVATTVVILTDGYIDVEAQVFQFVRDNLHRANFFAFSIGSSPNRYLTEGIATVGRGLEFWVADQRDVEAKTKAFLEFGLHSVLTNVHVTYHDHFQATELIPLSGLLLAERPLILCGKYKGAFPPPGSKLFTVSATNARGQEWSVDILAPSVDTPLNHRALPALWARAMIEDRRFTERDPEASIVPLALQYSILTEYTSFLAIDNRVRFDPPSNVPLLIHQPIPLPLGFDSRAVGIPTHTLGRQPNPPQAYDYYSGGSGIPVSNGAASITLTPPGTLPMPNGGTGMSSYTTGDILYASVRNVIVKELGFEETLPVSTGGTEGCWKRVSCADNVNSTCTCFMSEKDSQCGQELRASLTRIECPAFFCELYHECACYDGFDDLLDDLVVYSSPAYQIFCPKP